MNKLLAILIVSISLTGCGPKPTDAQLTLIQESVAVLEEEIDANRRDLVDVESPVDRAKLEVAIDLQLKQVRILKKALASAEDISDAKWTTGEAVIGMIGAVFPPALLALPWIRTLRRQRKAIFESIKAGGGPAVPDAARKSLMDASPQARRAYKRWKSKAA